MEILKTKKVRLIKLAAKKFGVRAFIVGGAARDLILGSSIKDLDFLIEGDAIEFAKCSNFEIKSIHKDFRTVKIKFENDEIDIASTRSETYKLPGALPCVDKIGIKIEDDLSRRDFTINSIAIDISDGKIIDVFDGQKDIKNGLLKVLHNKSFIDDPTRILRGLDFKYRFNFDFDKNTKNLMQDVINSYDNRGLSIDRIYLTLNKIFSSKSADKILKEILDKKIYKIWMKKTYLSPEDINNLKKAGKIFNVQNTGDFFIMALEAVSYIKAPFNDDFEIYEFFKKFSPAQLALYYFKTQDSAAIKYLKLKDIKTEISGKILIEQGYQQGTVIGNILNTVLRQKILYPQEFKNRTDELNFVFKHFPQHF